VETGPEIPAVRTARLLLRDWREEDRAPFAALNADPVVMEHFPTPLARRDSDAAVDRFRAGWREHGYGLWAAERRDTGAFVGFVGLGAVTFEAAFTPAVEVGWRLAREHWGVGLATEGARASLRYAFEVVGLPAVVSFTAVGNRRSRAVMERLGMRRVGEFEHPGVPPGHTVRPHVLYRLAAPDWRAGQGDAG
jgi:RimJ/RimL family protein N-acetyltransferase